MLTALAVANYRSLRGVIAPLARLNVVTGANGSGKSSLYRALRLLAETGQGRLIASLAREGGLPSTLWAGPERLSRGMKAGHVPVQGGPRTKPVQLQLGFAREDFNYAVELGVPGGPTAFFLDPEIKRECVWSGPVFRPARLLVDRRGPSLRAMDEGGAMAGLPGALSPFASMMTEFADPRQAPELALVRGCIQSWRFYDHMRTDAEAPARQPQVGTYTPVLDHDGSDVAAALQTIRRSATRAGSTRLSTTPFPAARSASTRRPAASRWPCASRGCCGRSRRANCRTARCATSS